ncbi:MAG: DUF1592 domain-containing protein [Myxococcaceae bacterium]|nr:DUF1592 domain-containing protein [Myxococcaceae bacterium]
MRRALAPALLLVAVSGCEGSILPAFVDGIIDHGAPTSPGPGPGTTPEPTGPAACAPSASPLPTLTRLSTHEYRAMVADVLGVAVDPALFSRWTPVAAVHGFDTMSSARIDAQGFEEQFATADALATLVLSTPALTAHCPAPRPAQTPACALKAGYASTDDFSDAQDRDCWTYLDSGGARMAFDNMNARWRKEPDQGAYLWRTGAHPGSTVDAVRRWTAPVDGTVTLSGSFADADTGGGDGVLVTIRHAGATVFSRDLPNGGSSPFSATFAVARGDVVDFVVNRKTNASWDTTAFTASVALAPTARKQAWAWTGCVEPLVTRLASRAFRRPLRADEASEYQALFTTSVQGAATAGFAEPVDEALRAVLQAVFLSPNFVFKPELVPAGLEPGERSFGTASRLALFVRGSVPDDTLWALAQAGALEDEAVLRREVERLLTQDRARFTKGFAGQWLDFREAPAGALGASMQRESAAVFEAVLSEDLPAERLLRPGFTIVDAALGAHYGLGNTASTPMRVTSATRGGVLSQGSFLVKTGGGSEFRRPIHRGIWVLSRLLCRPLPSLDPATLEEIGNSFNTINRSLPLPEQMKLHRDSSNRCGGCHAHIDPIGLSLEQYDEAAQWRTTYPGGAPIVSDLELDGVRVRDPHELSQAIENTADFRACVASRVLTFALNRGLRSDEQCLAERLARPLDGSTPGLQTLTVQALLKALPLTEVRP